VRTLEFTSIAAAAAIICCVAGCASQSRLLHAECARQETDGQLTAVEFVSSFEAVDLAREQVIYQVRLIDKNGQPIRSDDGRYETADGVVAAARTFFVQRSPQQFEALRVSIPADELAATPDLAPVFAEVGIYLPDGEQLASMLCEVPIFASPAAAPDAEQADVSRQGRQSYWFMRPTEEGGLPILVGPFDSAKDALTNAPVRPSRPRVVSADDDVWFLQLSEPDNPGKPVLVGPCLSEQDAARTQSVLVKELEAQGRGPIVATTRRVKLQEWFSLADEDDAPRQ